MSEDQHRVEAEPATDPRDDFPAELLASKYRGTTHILVGPANFGIGWGLGGFTTDPH